MLTTVFIVSWLVTLFADLVWTSFCIQVGDARRVLVTRGPFRYRLRRIVGRAFYHRGTFLVWLPITFGVLLLSGWPLAVIIGQPLIESAYHWARGGNMDDKPPRQRRTAKAKAAIKRMVESLKPSIGAPGLVPA